VSEPTAAEQAFAARLKLDPAAVAAARDALNAIASLSWPKTERVSLLARLARAAKADVGKVFGAAALNAAPLASFDTLIPIPGLGDKRVAGLVRALSTFDIATVVPEIAALREAQAAVAALRAENLVLRTDNSRLRVTSDPLRAENAALRAAIETMRAELDRLRAAQPPATTSSAPAVMRIADVARSIGSQVAQVDQMLRSRPTGLRLGTVDLRLTGTATAFDGDVALDLGSPAGGSAVGISFAPGGSEAGSGADAPVPDVRGYTTALAQRKLRACGFAVASASVAGARGVVTEQSPSPGALARAGSVVRLIVRDPGPVAFDAPR
jgi:hypothetical protein